MICTWQHILQNNCIYYENINLKGHNPMILNVCFHFKAPKKPLNGWQFPLGSRLYRNRLQNLRGNVSCFARFVLDQGTKKTQLVKIWTELEPILMLLSHRPGIVTQPSQPLPLSTPNFFTEFTEMAQAELLYIWLDALKMQSFFHPSIHIILHN